MCIKWRWEKENRILLISWRVLHNQNFSKSRKFRRWNFLSPKMLQKVDFARSRIWINQAILSWLSYTFFLNFEDCRVWLWQIFFADTWDLEKFWKPLKNRFFHVMLFRRFIKFWIIWAILYFYENFDGKNNIVLTVEHIDTNFFLWKVHGIKVWLLLYPLRLTNPHSMQIWDCTHMP